jgi:hypothetical protein
MVELIRHPITISIALLILGLLIAIWFNGQEDTKKKAKELGRKTSEFGKKTVRVLRRKALRKSLSEGDWTFK